MQPNLQRHLEQSSASLLSAVSVPELATVLEIPLSVLNYYAFHHREYHSFEVPRRTKSNGRARIIHAPNTGLKILQRKILQLLETMYEPTDYTYSFAQNRSVKGNAECHLGAAHLLNIDIRSFFPSITFYMVRDALIERASLNPQIARVLANITCIHTGEAAYLPQGAPTSPFISNMVMHSIDLDLARYSSRYAATYSRYADDITISTKEAAFPPKIAKKDIYGQVWINNGLHRILKSLGFEINYQKVRLKSSKERQEVTGIRINGGRTRVRRSYIKNIRAILHKWERSGYEKVQAEYLRKFTKPGRYPEKPSARLIDHVAGKLAYLSMVNGPDDPDYIKLLNRFRALNPE